MYHIFYDLLSFVFFLTSKCVLTLYLMELSFQELCGPSLDFHSIPAVDQMWAFRDNLSSILGSAETVERPTP